MDGAAFRLLIRAAAGGALLTRLVRSILGVLGIAIGVALAATVHLVNHSAKSALEQAVRAMAGEADLIIRGGPAGFDELLYPRVAVLPGVASASPAIEGTVTVDGREDRLQVLGLDPLRALTVQPALLGSAIDRVADLLNDDAVLLSTTAAEWLGVRAGEPIDLVTARGPGRMRVVGIVPSESFAQRVAILDIATAQWLLGRVGELARIDVKAASGADLAHLTREIEAMLPAGVHVVRPETESRRAAGLSRAYRVNLDMLALVALFTGSFVIFAIQALDVIRRRQQIGLMRALGVTRRALLAMLLLRAAGVGAIGSALGIVTALATAAVAIGHFGVDLGAGFFDHQVGRLRVEPGALLAFFALGVTAALAGSLVPALGAAAIPPATALKASSATAIGRIRLPGSVAVVLTFASGGLSLAPPIAGLPIPGYLAIASLLIAAVTAMPGLTQAICARLAPPRAPVAMLAVARLRAAGDHIAISLAAIVVSFSLMVAMLIMVLSFRGSLADWLVDVLPADLYLRAGSSTQPGIDADAQRAIAATHGVHRVTFVRYQSILVDPDRAPVTLIARDLPPGLPDALPLAAPPRLPSAGAPPAAWVSEALRDLHGWSPGTRIELPIAGRPVAFTVAGVWRDYARLGGAVLIDRALYLRLGGDERATDAWIWRDPSVAETSLSLALHAAVPAPVEIRSPAALRATSMRIFDRTFALTWALEAVAVLLGLFGIAVTFSAEAAARRAELAALRHLGLTRNQITRLIALEGALLGAGGVCAGYLVGWLVSLQLIHVVNRQSFHWSLDMQVPWAALALLGIALTLAAAVTAALSARHAVGDDLVRAVREDW